MLRTVVINGFWILGLAIMLASLSYHRYQAKVQGLAIRQQFGQPSFQATVYLGLALTAMGLAGTSSATWETIIWLILTAAAIIGAVRIVRSSR